MTSSINPDFITAAPVSKTGMKAQLGIARDEITALQADVAAIGTSFLQTGTGAVSRTWTAKLQEAGLFSGDFGADFTGVADAQDALQKLFNAAGSQGKYAIIAEGTYRVNTALTLPEGAAGLIMRGKIIYHGTGTALTIGSAGNTSRAQFKLYDGINIERLTITDWTSEAEIGVLARNLDNCQLFIKRVKGFTIGLRALGTAAGSGAGNAHGFEDNQINIGQFVDCRYSIDIRSEGQFSWNNSNRWVGGHYANSSTTNVTLSRFGVRFSRADITSYDIHNQHSFYSPAFELQRRSSDGSNAREAIPFLVEVAARGIIAHDMRTEACSQIVARHAANVQDCIYNVAYVGSWGYNLFIDYTGGTRGLGVIRVNHQMGGVEEAQRFIVGVDSARDSVYYDDRIEANAIAFEKMALLDGVAAGATLDAMVLTGGRSSFDLAQTYDVGIPGAYAVGYIVDCEQCKDFSLAIGGNNLQVVIAQWDAAQNELGGASPPRFNDIGVSYVSAAKWWASSINFDALDTVTYEASQKYYEHQRVQLHANARYAFIGVLGEGVAPGTGRLRALRLYAPARALAPRVLYGGQWKWGSRVTEQTVAIDFPSVAAGASSAQNVTVAGLRAGDQVLITPQSATTLQFFPVVGASNTLTVRFVNFTGGALDLASINFTLQITRRRA